MGYFMPNCKGCIEIPQILIKLGAFGLPMVLTTHNIILAPYTTWFPIYDDKCNMKDGDTTSALAHHCIKVQTSALAHHCIKVQKENFVMG